MQWHWRMLAAHELMAYGHACCEDEPGDTPAGTASTLVRTRGSPAPGKPAGRVATTACVKGSSPAPPLPLGVAPQLSQYGHPARRPKRPRRRRRADWSREGRHTRQPNRPAALLGPCPAGPMRCRTPMAVASCHHKVTTVTPAGRAPHKPRLQCSRGGCQRCGWDWGWGGIPQPNPGGNSQANPGGLGPPT